MKFIPYNAKEHFEICLSIYDSNCPAYFLEEERNDFIEWLNQTHKQPFWVFLKNEEIIGCGGVYSSNPIDTQRADIENEVGFAWGMIDAKQHKKGYGKEMSLFRINYLKEQFKGRPIVLRTTQNTHQFYRKLGFKVFSFIPNGFGEGMDKYIMVYENDEC